MRNNYCLLLFLVMLSLSAQEVQWQKDLPSATQDFLSGLSVTVDRQFLLSGSSIQAAKISGVSSGGAAKQNNGYDYHLVKLDQQGEEVWEKFYAGNNHDFLTATVATQEGGFLLAGTSYSTKGQDKKQDAAGGSDIWLIKLTEKGEEEWQQTFGTSGNEEARAVVQTTDLGYIIAGTIDDKRKGFGGKDVWIIKTDEKGNPLKELLLGGKGMDVVEKMIPTLDGGVLIGVYSRSGIGMIGNTAKKSSTNSKLKTTTEEESHFKNLKDTQDRPNSITAKNSNEPTTQWIAKNSENEGEGDFWVVKLDKDGNVAWQKNFGGAEDDHLRTMTLTSTGYVIGGESRSKTSGNKTSDIEEGTDVWLISLNQNGDKQWEKSYSFGNRDVMMSLSHITGSKSTETRGFLLGGYTQAEGRIEKDDETFWMLYIDPNGEEIWRKHVEGKSRQKEERLVTAQLLGDGSYVLAGTSAKQLGKENWKVVKLGDGQLDELIVKQDIKIYPNPVSDYCYVEIGFEFKEAIIELYDMGGRMLQSSKTKNKVTKINTADLPQAVYLIVAKTETKNASAKLIKK